MMSGVVVVGTGRLKCELFGREDKGGGPEMYDFPTVKLIASRSGMTEG
jgi:hypothetical protein